MSRRDEIMVQTIQLNVQVIPVVSFVELKQTDGKGLSRQAAEFLDDREKNNAQLEG